VPWITRGPIDEGQQRLEGRYNCIVVLCSDAVGHLVEHGQAMEGAPVTVHDDSSMRVAEGQGS